VLVDELKPYLESRGQASTAWIDAAVTRGNATLDAADANSSLAEKARLITVTNAQKLADQVNNTRTPYAYRRPFYTNPAAATR
jgi:hypothetical protein